MKKVHIIGAPGSGKTYLSNKLAEMLNAPLLELDQIHWNNSANDYNTRAPEDERDAKLAEFVSGDSWVVEGIYHKWVNASFEAADKIIILDCPAWVRDFRIIKRYILAKFGKDKSNENGLRSLWVLIKWGHSFDKERIPAIMEKTDQYKEKRVVISSADIYLSELSLPRDRFGDTPQMQDELAQLVLNGTKTATCSAYIKGEYVPQLGDRVMVEDSQGNDVCIIETTSVEIIPFNEVTEEFAYLEGEGDRTLDYWRKEHQSLFERMGTFDENMLLVCEKFKVVK